MLTLHPITQADRERFWNINQKYLYEMTLYYPDEMDEKGVLHYGYFDQYFVDAKRKAYFIYNDETLVGFVMINPYSVLGGNPDYTMAEFTIFPAFRRNGFGFEAATLFLSTFKGKWEIKFNEKNIGAKKFWTKITEKYNPKIHHLNEMETVLEFEN